MHRRVERLDWQDLLNVYMVGASMQHELAAVPSQRTGAILQVDRKRLH